MLYADHNQFYVDDVSAEDISGEFDNASFEDRVAVEPGFLAVFTATYGFVRVVLECLDEPAIDELARYDHVVEAPFAANSGSVSVLETTEAKAELTIPPGDYVARIGWSGVDGADQRDPEPDSDELETVHIQLRPGRLDERRVLKWYREWKPAAERPTNPHGLRLLVGRECDALPGLRVVGKPRDAEEYDDRSLVRDDTGTHWLHYYSRVPPYSDVMLELPESALGEYDPVDY